MLFKTGSIHRLILNTKWGSYVGSMEKSQPPVCVWKESCKKNINALISLASNDVIGLANNKCLLVERAKDVNLKSGLLSVYKLNKRDKNKLYSTLFTVIYIAIKKKSLIYLFVNHSSQW